MEVLALVATLAVAVGTWFVNGHLARRAVRRQMRVEFLLSAYSRLDAASNRPLTSGHITAIESATSDIQLLGTPRQVELADKFARALIADGSADSKLILEELRRSLRAELDLEALPAREMWLRMTPESLWAQEEASIKAQVPLAPLATGAALLATGATTSAPAASAGDASAAIDAVVAAHLAVFDELCARVSQVTAVPSATPNDQLIDLALARHVIAPETAQVIEGFTVMRDLAKYGQKKVSADEVQEYAALGAGLRYMIKRDSDIRVE